MKKHLFALFYTLSLFGCDSIEELRSTFCIENEVLITKDGHRYPRHAYASQLHFNLAYTLKDQSLAEQIHNAYKDHLHSLGRNAEFELALIEVAHYFGSADYSPLLPLQKALEARHQGQWFQTHREAVLQFIKQANRPLYRIQKVGGPFTVVIISTTCSGGNHSAALSLQHSLESQNIQVFVIDVEEVAKKNDPMMLATDTYTYDMVYSHILQKHDDLSVIKTRKSLYRDILHYIPNNFLKCLKERVIQLSPDLIISTRSYTCDDLSLATLGAPFCLYHADYELCPSLSSYYREVPSDRIQFLVPTEEMTKCGPNFKWVQYPCTYFYEMNNQDDLKKKWGIAQDEIPIFIAMGKHGAKHMLNLFAELKEAKTDLKLKYLFVCGKNESLKNELEQQATNSMRILGLLTPSEMNEVMNLSKMGISKAGGSTVTEAIATKTPLLLIGSYSWEEANGDYLVQMGLGKKASANEPLIHQIEELINKADIPCRLENIGNQTE